MRFSEKVVIVTGGASGIGLATAQRFASEQAKVVIADRDGQAAATAAQQLLTEGASGVLASACDVAVEAQVKASIDAAIDRFGRLDVVVNNAGLMTFLPSAGRVDAGGLATGIGRGSSGRILFHQAWLRRDEAGKRGRLRRQHSCDPDQSAGRSLRRCEGRAAIADTQCSH